jgi:hypothetical protein
MCFRTRGRRGQAASKRTAADRASGLRRGCLWLAACPVHALTTLQGGRVRSVGAPPIGGGPTATPTAAPRPPKSIGIVGGIDRAAGRQLASAVTRPLASRATASSRPTSTRRSVRRHLRSPSNTRASCRARGPGRASARGPHEVAGCRAAVCRGPRKASPCRRSTLGPRFAGAHKIGFGFGFGLGGRS